jgi:hypothetical protein
MGQHYDQQLMVDEQRKTCKIVLHLHRMQTPTRITARFAVAMTPTLPKSPLQQIQGQGLIDPFVRPTSNGNTNDDDAMVNTPTLQRRRKIRDDDDDDTDDDRPMANLYAAAQGTTRNPVVIHDTENESDANFGVILLPEQQPSQHPSRRSTRSRQTKARRAATPDLDQIAEQVRPLIVIPTAS